MSDEKSDSAETTDSIKKKIKTDLAGLARSAELGDGELNYYREGIFTCEKKINQYFSGDTQLQGMLSAIKNAIKRHLSREDLFDKSTSLSKEDLEKWVNLQKNIILVFGAVASENYSGYRGSTKEIEASRFKEWRKAESFVFVNIDHFSNYIFEDILALRMDFNELNQLEALSSGGNGYPCMQKKVQEIWFDASTTKYTKWQEDHFSAVKNLLSPQGVFIMENEGQIIKPEYDAIIKKLFNNVQTINAKYPFAINYMSGQPRIFWIASDDETAFKQTIQNLGR